MPHLLNSVLDDVELAKAYELYELYSYVHSDTSYTDSRRVEVEQPPPLSQTDSSSQPEERVSTGMFLDQLPSSLAFFLKDVSRWTFESCYKAPRREHWPVPLCEIWPVVLCEIFVIKKERREADKKQEQERRIFLLLSPSPIGVRID